MSRHLMTVIKPRPTAFPVAQSALVAGCQLKITLVWTRRPVDASGLSESRNHRNIRRGILRIASVCLLSFLWFNDRTEAGFVESPDQIT